MKRPIAALHEASTEEERLKAVRALRDASDKKEPVQEAIPALLDVMMIGEADVLVSGTFVVEQAASRGYDLAPGLPALARALFFTFRHHAARVLTDYASARSLARFSQDDRAIQALVRWLEVEDDPHFGFALLFDTLVDMKATVAPRLVKLLADGNARTRWRAAVWLARRGDAVAADTLAAFLTAHDNDLPSEDALVLKDLGRIPIESNHDPDSLVEAVLWGWWVPVPFGQWPVPFGWPQPGRSASLGIRAACRFCCGCALMNGRSEMVSTTCSRSVGGRPPRGGSR